jgi:chemotaxis response regulator CheB
VAATSPALELVSDASEREATRTPTEPIKVMIVDDDPDIRTVLRVLMEMEGFEVVAEARDGDEAVPEAMRTQPDVVILDYMMPKLDGAETANFIRTVAPHARILAFSGVIHELPEWADLFIEKGRLGEMAHLIARTDRRGPDS